MFLALGHSRANVLPEVWLKELGVKADSIGADSVSVRNESSDTLGVGIDMKGLSRAERRALRKRGFDTLTPQQRGLTIATATGVDKIKLIVDSLRESGVVVDSTTIDSLARQLFSDTLRVTGGVMPKINSDGSLTNARILDSLLFAERLAASRREMKREKVNIFRDSISFGKMSTLAVIMPGYGQAYNKQYWKMPVMYAGVGAFTAAGVLVGNKGKEYKTKFDNAVAEGNQTGIDTYYGQYRDYQTASTMLYVGAGLTYMYFLADAAFNYRWKEDDKNRAMYLAFMFPGAGQMYNGQYWKLPIVYGGFATMAYVINFNGRGYTRFKTAYENVVNGLPDEFDGRLSETVLQNTKNSFRRARDQAIFYTIGFYLITVVDAYVSASFKKYDISDDLSMQLSPSVEYMQLGRANASGSCGMSMNFTF